MKPRSSILARILPIFLATLLVLTALGSPAAARPFTVNDLVMLDRVSDPQLSPDGRWLAYVVRETDYQANKGINGIWLLELGNPKAQPRRLTAKDSSAASPRWAPDGKALFFLSPRGGSAQVWRLDLAGGEPEQVTRLPLDVGVFVLSPSGRHLALSLDVFPGCADLACTKKRLDDKTTTKASGVLYDRLFVRHWDTWADGRRAQLFLAELDAQGMVSGQPRWLSKGVDGNVPSRPFGGDEEITFTPDGKSVIFSARLADAGESWSTNFDLYQVPVDGDGSAAAKNLTANNPAWDTTPKVSPDGRLLAYTAMKRPGYEADRFAILLKDLHSGETREVAPTWDRSAHGLTFSPDGKTLYTTTNDLGQNPLFAIDVQSGKVKNLTGKGNVGGYTVARDSIVFARDHLGSPAQLFRMGLAGGPAKQLTQLNAERLRGVQLGAYEQFSFRGWNNETVYGYVVKPAGFRNGQKYPVAFIIHGGPQGSMGNDFHYRWNPQTYAGQGYAAVFIDFHGSTGYGQKFTDAIAGDWGGKPLEDLQKGWTAALAKYPFLDRTRACALGASYGGYMINWIAGSWPDTFQCLVNHDGIFDNRAMYYETEELWFPEWEHGKPHFEAPEGYERHNPVNLVNKWKTPMLVVQGELDYRVPVTQGLATFTALQRRGIPSQLLYFPDENHWVLKPQNSVQWHDTVHGWLKRWLVDQVKQPKQTR